MYGNSTPPTPSSMNPVTITKQVVGTVVGGALGVVDRTLDATADYVERGSHFVASPLLKQTELQYEDDDGGRHSTLAKIIDGVREQIHTGVPVPNSLEAATAIIDAIYGASLGDGQDDRKYLLETALTLLSRLPETKLKKKLTDRVITVLYYDLPHPPQAIVGRKHRYRSADGSGTSLWDHDMGKAGSRYARSVQGYHGLPRNELPSADLVFDALLKREGPKPEPHPAGLSSLFFAFANLVIHQLFYTTLASEDDTPGGPKTAADGDPQEPVNLTSSYLDLSILYGNNQKEQDSVRRNDGTGKMWEDCFADSRLARMPPSTGALAILFSRNHNYICQKLLEINENGTFRDPATITDSKEKSKQDNDLFQTARLVNCGFFMQTILSDYLAAILGLVREGNSWSLDPLTDFRNQDHSVSERGSGNVVSIEFTALYHFHSSISAKDEKWAEAMMRGMFSKVNGNWDEITPEMYKKAIKEMREKAKSPPQDASSSGTDTKTIPPSFKQGDPRHWEIFWAEGIWRNKDGSYDDSDLARILKDATEHIACAFKARGTPHSMRIIEWMAIEQNRDWGTCTLNAFRNFLGLKPYKTFEEWNPVPEVAEAARRLYGHPDNLELYVGLQAEQPKPVIEGAGLCASFTMTRAILADAVALVRGDRFLTTDFTSFNLTAWGYKDAIRNPNNSANGGTLAKLLMRTLPDHYPDDNAFTLFPLMTPSVLKGYYAKKGIDTKYKWERPGSRNTLKVIRDYPTASMVLEDAGFTTDYPDNANLVFSRPSGYLQMMNDRSASEKEIEFLRAQFASPNYARQHRDYISRQTQTLLKSKSYSLVGKDTRSVDIVRDVFTNLPIRFVADAVLGLPLKTEEHWIGNTLLEHELSEKLKAIYNFVFLQNDPTTHVARRESVKETVEYLTDVTAQHWAGILSILKLDFSIITDTIQSVTSEHTLCHEWLKRLKNQAGGRSDQQLLNDAVSLAVLIGAEYAQLLAHCLDAFLPDFDQEKKDSTAGKATSTDSKKLSDRFGDIVTAARQASSSADLKRFVIEALKQAPAIPGVYRNVKSVKSSSLKSDRGTPISSGDRVYISLSEALSNSSALPPSTTHDERKLNNDPVFVGDGLMKLLGQDYVVDFLLIPALKPILGLKGLRRARGNSGKAKSFNLIVDRTGAVDDSGNLIPGSQVKVRSYLDKNQVLSPWSRNMVVTFSA